MIRFVFGSLIVAALLASWVLVVWIGALFAEAVRIIL